MDKYLPKLSEQTDTHDEQRNKTKKENLTAREEGRGISFYMRASAISA